MNGGETLKTFLRDGMVLGWKIFYRFPMKDYAYERNRLYVFRLVQRHIMVKLTYVVDEAMRE